MTIAQAPVLPSSRLISQARLAQVLTITWMLIELVVAIGVGIAARSIALTAFGFDSAVEVLTAVVVLGQLAGPQSVGPMDARARRVSRIVGVGLYAVAAYIVVSSGAALLLRVHPEPSTAGVALAVASMLFTGLLWRWRLSLSGRLHNAPLRADAACSAVCLYMAATMLVGLALNRGLGLWWADPLAALAMTWWIRGEASEALEAARTGHHCEDC